MKMRTNLVAAALALLGLVVGCEKGDAAGDAVASGDAAADVTAEAAAPDASTLDVPLSDAVVAVCPDEKELTPYLPCTCYGKLVTDPAAYWPGCLSQVVCCPTCQGLRCEDHEYYDIPNDCVPPGAETGAEAVEAAAEPAPEPQPEVVDEVAPEPQPEVAPTDTAEQTPVIPKCPYEVDLANVTLPCLCGDLEVSNLAHALPGCTKKIVCCPLGGLKCE